MPRPRFPQFEDGEKAGRETAERLKRAAEVKARNNETIAREREALERSRILLKLPRDPFEIAMRSPRGTVKKRRKKRA
jgi:hypothetical protein